ncbi:unnamed protein product [Echinostoma caproni]|uniref:Probable RNA polymerase II nuclear localization protein SLC7A6OS n=1 Tax=Echinostoma caproni TaxID=27848 RepID=A0A183B1B8_9TREM|nr:unnamed protein product [Echinostoma caproni]
MAIILRVKRLRKDVPVDSFETERLNKMSKIDADEKSASTFRYIGSQSIESNVAVEPDLNKLDKLNSQGSFKLLWNSTCGRIVGKGVTSVPCAVRINSLKRSLPLPNTDPDVPVKMMRIIDITPDRSNDDDLTSALHQAAILESSQAPKDEVDYVYDLYRLEKRRTARLRNRSGSLGGSVSPLSRRARVNVNGASVYPRDDIVFDGELSDPDDKIYADDEDDSNSESNWRNDYPDEEDVSSPSSESHSSCSDDQSDSDSDRPNYRYSQHDLF